jgi:adenylate cyclase
MPRWKIVIRRIRAWGPALKAYQKAAIVGRGLARYLRGQVVVVGATATGTGDRFATPFDRVMPGVEIFATAISNLLAGDGLVRDRVIRGTDAVIAVALPAATVLLLALSPPWLAIAVTRAAFVAWIAALVIAFTVRGISSASEALNCFRIIIPTDGEVIEGVA